MTLAKCQASYEELDKGNEEGEKEFLLNEAPKEVEEGLDEGEMLMIRWALSGLASQNDLEQRENTFHTQSIICGKACSLIIDEGSCA